MTSTNTLNFRPERLICETPGCYKAVMEPWEETGRLCPDCSIQTELFDRQGRWERLGVLDRLPALQTALSAI